MKIYKIGLLSLALIASLFFLNTTTRAAIANVNLEITGTSGTCAFGTISNLGAIPFSWESQVLSGAFTGTSAPDGNTWRCFDGNGTASWNASMIILNDLENQTNTSLKIPMTGVSYSNYPVHQQIGSGTCTAVQGASASPTDWKYLSTSQKILEKFSTIGQVCRIQTTGLYLKVELPGGTNVGLYSGTLMITLPVF